MVRSPEDSMSHFSPTVTILATRIAALAGLSVCLSAPALAADGAWPQFRGPGARAVADEPGLPATWSKTENVEWVTAIPGLGWSSPVVWDGKVFLTSTTSGSPLKPPSLGVDFSNDYVAELLKQGKTEKEMMALVQARDSELPSEVSLKYNLFCLDLETGRILWTRTFHDGPPPVGRHRKNSYTSETPVTDGKAVYVYVAFLGVYAFDFQGTPLWHTPLEPHKVYLDFGAGSSPVLHGDTLVILNDNEEASFIAGFDKKTGKELWRTGRPGLGTEQMRSAWSTPFVWENAVRTEIVTTGPGVAISYDLLGRELWRLSLGARMSIQSPFSWEGLVYLTAGTAGSESRPIAAIRPGASGNITPGEGKPPGQYVAWLDPLAGGTYLPTPLVYDGGLYTLTDKGIFTRLDPKTGERTYKTRLRPDAGNFTASPWAYDGKIFCLSEEGDTFVVKAGKSFELLAVNSLDEFSMATPAISRGRLLVRTKGHLYSLRKKAGPAD
jgi:outer membrane protein assembly factor BamB